MTFAANIAEYSQAVLFMEEIYELGSIDAVNLVGIEAALLAAASGDFSKQGRDRLRATRTTIASALRQGNLVRVFTPIYLNMAASINSTARANQLGLLIRDVQKYMDDNLLTIPSRGLTLGTPTADATNVGDGVITRCSTDRFGYQIESTWAEAKTFDCVADQGNGTKGQEIFAYNGSPFKIDTLELGGSGVNGAAGGFVVQGIDARRADLYLANASFDEGHGASGDDVAPSQLPGWAITAGVIGDLRMRTNAAYVFRTTQGVDQGWGLEFKGDVTIKQVFGADGAADPRLTDAAPFYEAILLKTQAGATGQAVLSLGSQSVTLDLSTLTNGVWFRLILTPDERTWYSNWAEDGQGVELAITSLTGDLVVDDGILFPFTFLDGTYYAAHGGATPWKVGRNPDAFSLTDALDAAEAVLQFWGWRAALESFPHAGTASEVTAAGGRTLTFADADPDTITASTGSFIDDGYERGQTLTVAGTSSNNGTYKLAIVTALVLTLKLDDDELAAEGPISSSATLNAAPTFADP